MKLEWEKLGRLFVPTKSNSPSWMAEYAQAPNALLLQDRIRIFFTTRLPRDEKGQYVSRVAFIDVDREYPLKILGLSTQPVIDLGGPGCFDEHGTYPFSAVQVGDEISAVYGGWSRCSSVPFDVSIGLAKGNLSNLIFKKIGNGPVVTKSQYEPFVIASPKIRFFNNQWYLFYTAGSTWLADPKVDPVYKIRMATSINGTDWNKLHVSIVNNLLGEFEAQASPDVFFFNDQYHMLFCYRYGSNFRNNERGYRIGYAFSEDLVNWTRDDSKSNLTTSDVGWDSEDVSYPNVIKVNDHLYCFYLGNQVGKTGFGVARMKII
jgi:hypothetical protein